MELTRREFIGTVSSAAAITGGCDRTPALWSEDPLGVRGDFPVVEEGVYLDSAYIAPSPTPTDFGS